MASEKDEYLLDTYADFERYGWMELNAQAVRIESVECAWAVDDGPVMNEYASNGGLRVYVMSYVKHGQIVVAVWYDPEIWEPEGQWIGLAYHCGSDVAQPWNQYRVENVVLAD